jgi:hypothetical protein
MEATNTHSSLKKLEEVAGSSFSPKSSTSKRSIYLSNFQPKHSIHMQDLHFTCLHQKIVATKAQDGYRRFNVFRKLRTESSHKIWNVSLAAKDPRVIEIIE